MQRSSLLLLCALISAVAARATPMSKWPTIGTFATPDGGRATVFLDTHSITRHGDFWTARLRTLFTIDQKNDGGESFRSEMDVYAYDCREARAALVSSVTDDLRFGKDGSGRLDMTSNCRKPVWHVHKESE